MKVVQGVIQNAKAKAFSLVYADLRDDIGDVRATFTIRAIEDLHASTKNQRQRSLRRVRVRRSGWAVESPQWDEQGRADNYRRGKPARFL